MPAESRRGVSKLSSDKRWQSRAPREPVTTLNAAIGRTDATLGPDTVLGEAVENARAIIVTVDEDGAPQDQVFSGLTPEKKREHVSADILPAGRDAAFQCGDGESVPQIVVESRKIRV